MFLCNSTALQASKTSSKQTYRTSPCSFKSCMKNWNKQKKKKKMKISSQTFWNMNRKIFTITTRLLWMPCLLLLHQNQFRNKFTFYMKCQIGFGVVEFCTLCNEWIKKKKEKKDWWKEENILTKSFLLFVANNVLKATV